MESFYVVMIMVSCLIGLIGGIAISTHTPLACFHFAYIDLEGTSIDAALKLFKFRCPPLKRHQGVEVRLIPGFIWTDEKGEKHEFQDYVRVSKMFFRPLFGDDPEGETSDSAPVCTMDYLKETVKKAGLKITDSGYY